MHEPTLPCSLFDVGVYLADIGAGLSLLDDYFEEGPNEHTPEGEEKKTREAIFLFDAPTYRSLLHLTTDSLRHLQDWVQRSIPANER